MTNGDIVNIYLKNGLIKTCVDCQFKRMGEKWKFQYKDDFFQDLIVTLLKYDNAKLNDVQSKGVMNGFLTRVILNQLYSNTSYFYTNYLKYNQYGKIMVDLEEIIEKENYDRDEEEDRNIQQVD